MQSESNEKLPAVEIVKSGRIALVIIRRNFEQVVRDDEGTVWVWEEHKGIVPYFEGMQEEIEANQTPWADYLDCNMRAAELEREHAAAVAAATNGLPEYQTGNDAAIGELGALAADAMSKTTTASARVDDLEQAVAELGTLIASS